MAAIKHVCCHTWILELFLLNKWKKRSLSGHTRIHQHTIKIHRNVPSTEILWKTIEKSVLPTMKKFLSPFNVEETKTKIQKAKQHQKKYYDKNAHDLIELREGYHVTVQPYGKSQYWKRAVVIEKFEYWRYMIELENGKRLVRNRRHLRLTTKPKHSNMTKTNHKQDITSNDSEQNTKLQQPDMAERQPHLKSHRRQDTQPIWWMATRIKWTLQTFVCMGDVGRLIYISGPILVMP